MASTAAVTRPSGHDAEQIERANDTGLQPVVFVHGLWLLSSSWQRWAELFEANGYVAIAPGWPDDPETVDDAIANPQALADKTLGQIADYLKRTLLPLHKKPALVGHSFGGLLVQMLAGRGFSAATVAISPAPFRGVLSLPLSSIKSGWPILHNPANYHRAVPLSFEEFRYGFANAVSDTEARELHDTFAVPGSGAPLFQAATANLNPWTEAQVDAANPQRGPLLIIAGGQDNTVPASVSNGAFEYQQRNSGVTEIVELPDRGHALTIDHGWLEVAETAISFISRFV